MQRELLHAVAKIEQTKMSGTNHAAGRAHKQFPTALNHIDAHVVEKGARYLSGAANPDVVAGIRAAATAAMRHQEIIPAIVIDHHRGFAIDRKVPWCVIRVETPSR